MDVQDWCRPCEQHRAVLTMLKFLASAVLLLVSCLSGSVNATVNTRINTTCSSAAGNTDKYCYGEMLISTDTEYKRLVDLGCTHLLGSLEIVGIDSVHCPLNIQIIDGYLRLKSVLVSDFSSILPLLKSVNNNFGGNEFSVEIHQTALESLATRNGSRIFASEVWLQDNVGLTDTHTCQLQPGCEEDDCCKTGLSKGKASMYFTDNTSARKNVPWSMPCPQLCDVEDPIVLGPSSNSPMCYQAYNCENASYIQHRDICTTECGSMVLTAIEQLCVVPLGCSTINGNLEIYISGNATALPQKCLPRLGFNPDLEKPDLETLLGAVFAHLVSIRGRLVLAHTTDLFTLEFFCNLTEIRHDFADQSCNYSRNAAVLIDSTSLHNISSLAHVRLNGSVRLYNNYRLCHKDYTMTTIEDAGRNGLFAFCQVCKSEITSNILSWSEDCRNTSMETDVCKAAHEVYFCKTGNETGDCTRSTNPCLGQDPSWKSLILVENATSMDLGIIDRPCDEFRFAVCTYLLTDSGAVMGISRTVTGELYRRPGPRVTFNTAVQLPINTLRLVFETEHTFTAEEVGTNITVRPEVKAVVWERNARCPSAPCKQLADKGLKGRDLPCTTNRVNESRLNLSSTSLPVPDMCGVHRLNVTIPEFSLNMTDCLSGWQFWVRLCFSGDNCTGYSTTSVGNDSTYSPPCVPPMPNRTCKTQQDAVAIRGLRQVHLYFDKGQSIPSNGTECKVLNDHALCSYTVCANGCNLSQVSLADISNKYPDAQLKGVYGQFGFNGQCMSLCNASEDVPIKDGMNERAYNGPPIQVIVPILAVACIGLVFFTLFIRWKHRKAKDKLKTELAVANRTKLELLSDYHSFGEYIADPSWELVADSVALVREVGEGAFGQVYEGVLATIEDGDLCVAVKTLAEGHGVRQKNVFLAEASVMKKFDSPYVTKLLGIVSKAERPLVVMEYLENGDLRAYLIKCRPGHRNFLSASSSATLSEEDPEEESCIPASDQFLRWAVQLARGMVHLNEKHFVHRDLAARNCMLSADLTLKVGDFGLTRDIYESDYYRHGDKGGVLPLRWLGPESLRDGLFISSSDVWSYGVVLWEMATLGHQPYRGKSNEEALNFITEGGTMERPILRFDYPEILLDVMEQCWAYETAERPTFAAIQVQLEISTMPFSEV